MQEGTVKFFDNTKGFGFITATDGEEIFVHNSGLRDDIREGDNVQFNTAQGRKGLNAVDVEITD